jgi:HSP20 family protein
MEVKNGTGEMGPDPRARRPAGGHEPALRLVLPGTRDRADLPGVDGDDVDIEVKDDVLTVSGERRSEHEDKGEGFYRMERSFGRFSRSIDLPSGIEAGAVSADFENGVLEVRIPKPAQAQPTKVAIGAGDASENGSE